MDKPDGTLVAADPEVGAAGNWGAAKFRKIRAGGVDYYDVLQVGGLLGRFEQTAPYNAVMNGHAVLGGYLM